MQFWTIWLHLTPLTMMLVFWFSIAFGSLSSSARLARLLLGLTTLLITTILILKEFYKLNEKKCGKI